MQFFIIFNISLDSKLNVNILKIFNALIIHFEWILSCTVT